jgi:hypothetical protein
MKDRESSVARIKGYCRKTLTVVSGVASGISGVFERTWRLMRAVLITQFLWSHRGHKAVSFFLAVVLNTDVWLWLAVAALLTALFGYRYERMCTADKSQPTGTPGPHATAVVIPFPDIVGRRRRDDLRRRPSKMRGAA